MNNIIYPSTKSKPLAVFYNLYQLFRYSTLFCFFLLFSWNAFAIRDVDGSFRLRSVLHQFQGESSPPFFIQGRLDIKGEFQLSNEFKTKIYLLSSNAYDNTWSVKESIKIYPSATWLINEDLELKLGRNIYNNKFHHIVSANDYEPFFYVFDGVFLEYSTKILNVNFWSASLPKRWIGSELVDEFKYGVGLFLDIESISDYIDYFNAYAGYLGDSLFKSESQKMFRYGLGLEGTINMLDLIYTFVAVRHGPGVQFKLKEDMYHFSLSYSPPEFLNSKIFIGYHTDSSQYKPWLYDRHRNAGLSDIFLWGNLTYYFFGLSSSVASLFDIQILFYDLSSTEKGPVQTGYFGSALSVGNENFINVEYKNLGKELDIQLKTQISKDFEIQLLAGLFIPHFNSRKLFTQADYYNNIQLTGFYKF